MENGIYAARKSNARIDSIFIDEERIEMECLNHRVKARKQAQEQAAQQERETILAEQKRQQAEAMKRKRRTWQFCKKQGKLVAALIIVFAGHQMGLVAWEFAAPVLVGLQTVICFRAGRYFGGKNGR